MIILDLPISLFQDRDDLQRELATGQIDDFSIWSYKSWLLPDVLNWLYEHGSNNWIVTMNGVESLPENEINSGDTSLINEQMWRFLRMPIRKLGDDSDMCQIEFTSKSLAILFKLTWL